MNTSISLGSDNKSQETASKQSKESTKSTDIVNNNIDILIISETKLDSSFAKAQFQIHAFSEPYRFEPPPPK